MGGTFSREAELVVQCLRAAVQGEQPATESFERGMDWDRVLELSIQHSVSPLVFEGLRNHEALPDDALERFRTRSTYVGQRNLRTLQEASALSTAFEKRGIRAIPYRGPIIAQLVYGDVGRREFGDIDFLVSQEAIPQLRSMLFDRGYDQRYVLEGTESLTDRQERAYARFCRDLSFTHPSKAFEVELHWRIIGSYFPTAFDLETVWSRRSSLSVAGTDVPILSPEDRLLMCCIHGTSHRWERLHWVCDVATFLRDHAVEWETVYRRARTHHCERMVSLGLAIADDLFDVPIPDRVRQSIESDPAIAALRTHVFDRLFDETSYWYWDLRRYQSRTLERRYDRAVFWIRGILEPGGGDVELISLPRSLAPLYSVARWYRIGRQATSQLLATHRQG